LIVDGRPFLALGGELYNNGATMVGIHETLVEGRLAAMHGEFACSCTIGWATARVVGQGKFERTRLVDGLIRGARDQNVRLIISFGSADWKLDLVAAVSKRTWGTSSVN
jgi:hypothetical protein